MKALTIISILIFVSVLCYGLEDQVVTDGTANITWSYPDDELHEPMENIEGFIIWMKKHNLMDYKQIGFVPVNTDLTDRVYTFAYSYECDMTVDFCVETRKVGGELLGEDCVTVKLIVEQVQSAPEGITVS